jgi:hypothetical protein
MHTYLSGRVRQSRADKDELWRQDTLSLEVRAFADGWIGNGLDTARA